MKKTWRVGTITAGILCISLGLIWIFSNLNNNINLFSIIYFLFPITLILLGLEILIQFWLKDKTPIKIDVLSIFIIFFLLISSSIALVVSPTGALYQGVQSLFEDTISVPFSKEVTDLDEINEIVIDSVASNVKLIGKPETNSVNIFGNVQTVTSRENDVKEILDKNLIINKVGSQLRISYNTNNLYSLKTRFTSFNDDDINIACPENIAVRVEGRNSGNLVIENINNGLTINSNDTDIDLKNISPQLIINSDHSTIKAENVNGELEVTSNGGEIYLKELNLTAQGKFNLNNGDLKIYSLVGNLKIQSENSSTLLDDCTFTGTNNINSNNGDINLIVAEESDLLISAKINEGEVTGDHQDWSLDENNAKGTLQLNDGTNKLNIVKQGGNLNFSRIN